jgi:hypothetical protein
MLSIYENASQSIGIFSDRSVLWGLSVELIVRSTFVNVPSHSACPLHWILMSPWDLCLIRCLVRQQPSFKEIRNQRH